MLTTEHEAILAIDTSTTICSVALEIGGKHYAKTKHAGRDQAKTLLPVIRDLLEERGVSIDTLALCVCSRGPGSFVGLRVALNTAKGFYGALGIPFVTVPTHETYRHAYINFPNPIIAITQATKTVFYIAAYYRGQELLATKEMDIPALQKLIQRLRASHPQTEPTASSIDANLLRYIGDETGIITQQLSSSAIVLCAIGKQIYAANGMDALTINPYYLRKIDAEK